jgi:stage III sporulation protein AB
MDYKWIGAILILSASSCFGFSLIHGHHREESALRNLLRALDYMASELHFHAPPLPELCRSVSEICGRSMGRIFLDLADALDENQTPDAAACMDTVLNSCELPPAARENLRLLGSSLGRFDLDGQLKGLESARTAARGSLDMLLAHREQRLRNYQTLSLCAGADLVILLI